MWRFRERRNSFGRDDYALIPATPATARLGRAREGYPTELRILLSEPSAQDVTFTPVITAATADGADFTMTITTNIPAGATNVSLKFTTTVGNSEADEFVTVALSNVVGAAVQKSQATLLILDAAPQTLLIEGPPPILPSADPITLTIPVWASFASSIPGVDFITIEETAAANTDFIPISGHLDFTGAYRKDIQIVIPGGVIRTMDRSFLVALVNPLNAVLLNDYARVRLLAEVPPDILGFTIANGEGQITFRSQPGVSYLLESTTDMTAAQWQQLNIISSQSGEASFHVLASGAQSFFRIRQQP